MSERPSSRRRERTRPPACVTRLAPGSTSWRTVPLELEAASSRARVASAWGLGDRGSRSQLLDRGEHHPLAHLFSTLRRKRYRMRRCSHSEAGDRASPLSPTLRPPPSSRSWPQLRLRSRGSRRTSAPALIVAGLAAAKRQVRRGDRPPAIDPEQVEQLTAALDGGACEASVCRSLQVARSTLLATLERVGWTAPAKA